MTLLPPQPPLGNMVKKAAAPAHRRDVRARYATYTAVYATYTAVYACTGGVCCIFCAFCACRFDFFCIFAAKLTSSEGAHNDLTMNFVFISPAFPRKFWQWCDALKQNGVTVLGIGDTSYDELAPELKESLTEYYRVGNMEDYDEMYRAVAYFAHRYGRIDWIESNNEYWLEQDARLRTDFNVTTGQKSDRIMAIKEKSEMKKYYAAGGIRTARQIRGSEGLKAAERFASEAGYPLFVKPDIGVGATDSYKLEDAEALARFFEKDNCGDYVIEEFVTGDICTYDAIINSKGEPLLESMCVCPPSIADIVIQNLDSTYYVESEINENLRFWGRQTVKAFDVRSRMVHLEFFRLDRPRKGLGNKGDFVALEVNMRPGGGFTPDMINYAHETDVYKVWADMVVYDERRTPETPDNYFCVFAGRRDNVAYVHSHDDVMARYADALKMWDRLPAILAGAMGDQTYVARFRTREEMDEFLGYVCDRA